MKTLLISYLLLALVINSYGKSPSQTDTLEYAIISNDPTGKYIFKDCKPASLNQAETELIQTLLRKAVKEHNRTNKLAFAIIRPLEGYKIQLVPVLNSKGEKEVWVNCLCSVQPNWKTEIVMVSDGGNCYFSVKMNLKTKRTYDLHINGEA